MEKSNTTIFQIFYSSKVTKFLGQAPRKLIRFIEVKIMKNSKTLPMRKPSWRPPSLYNQIYGNCQNNPIPPRIQSSRQH